MVFNPITLWQIDEKVETMADFIFLGSRIIVNSDCSQGMKSLLFLGRKAMTNLDSILKSKDITLLTTVCMHGCESWTIKQAEHQRTDAYELWC